jgi:hypothetical protein
MKRQKHFWTYSEDLHLIANQDDLKKAVTLEIFKGKTTSDLTARLEILKDTMLIQGKTRLVELVPTECKGGILRILAPRKGIRDFAEVQKDFEILPIEQVMIKHQMTRGAIYYAVKYKKQPPADELCEVTPGAAAASLWNKHEKGQKLLPISPGPEEPDQITLLIGIKNLLTEQVEINRETLVELQKITSAMRESVELWKRAEGRQVNKPNKSDPFGSSSSVQGNQSGGP